MALDPYFFVNNDYLNKSFNMRTSTLLINLCILGAILSGCSARHIEDQYLGSTAQRLISHSLDSLIKDLPDTALPRLKNKTVFLQSLFITETQLSKYAHERLAMELTERFKATVVDKAENVDYEIKVFFTSIGTDRDRVGFTLPLPYTPSDNAPADIPLLAIDMYHGISEMYFYITDHSTGEVSKSAFYKATTKTDKIATPIISFPINNLK